MIEDIPKEKLLDLFRNLLAGRRMEEKLYEVFSAGGSGMPWLHRGIGEEAVIIGVCANLRKDDYYLVTITRGRPCLFARGFSFVDCIASESFKDVKKIGGHNTYFAPELGNLGRSGTLGEDTAIYTGAALSAKIRGTDQVTVCTIGDGAASRGPVHESMVVASAWDLPIVYLLQNNQYGEGTSARRETYKKMEDISDRAKAYGFPGITVDGNDVVDVYEVSKKYIERARKGGGPGLIVAETYRLSGHSEGDTQNYRPKGETEEWWKKDPLPQYTKRLMDMGTITEEYIDELDRRLTAEIDEAAEVAASLPEWNYDDYIRGAGTVIDVL